jgi:hypothetical protein
MGKRTIKKKRNTRKRNTLKRKKNTLKKNTFKRKKINLRKLGGSPRAEPPIVDLRSSSLNLSDLTDPLKKRNLNKKAAAEWEGYMYPLPPRPGSPTSPSLETPIADSLILNNDILVRKKKYKDMVAKLNAVWKNADATTLERLYQEYENNPTEKSVIKLDMFIEKHLEYFEKKEEDYLNWLKNKNSSFFERSLLCKPPSDIYEEGTMKIFLEDLRGGVKNNGVEKLVIEDDVTYYSIILFDKTNKRKSTKMYYRWKDLIKLSKKYKNIYKRTYNYKPLANSKNCYDRILAINKFFNQDIYTNSNL